LNPNERKEKSTRKIKKNYQSPSIMPLLTHIRHWKKHNQPLPHHRKKLMFDYQRKPHAPLEHNGLPLVTCAKQFTWVFILVLVLFSVPLHLTVLNKLNCVLFYKTRHQQITWNFPQYCKIFASRQSKQATKSNLIKNKCEGTRLKKKKLRDCNSKRDMLSLDLANYLLILAKKIRTIHFFKLQIQSLEF